MRQSGRFLLFSLFVVFGNLFCSARNSPIDSLKKLLPTSSDTNEVNVLWKLASHYSISNSDSGFKYAFLAYEKAEALSYSKGLMNAASQLGYCQIITSQYDKAITSFNTAIKISEENNYQDIAPTLFNRLAAAYYYKGDFEKAMQSYVTELQIAEKLNSIDAIIDANNGIASIYYSKGEYDNALTYYRAAVNACKGKAQDMEKANGYSNIGSVYNYKNQYDSSLIYYERAIDLCAKLADSSSVAAGMSNMAMLYINLNEYGKSRDYFMRSIEIQKNANDKNGLLINYSNLGLLYSKQKEYDMAFQYINKALDIAKEIGRKELVKDIYKQMAETYYEMGETKKAYDFYKMYSDEKDTLLNETNSKAIAELQTKYQSEKKQEEINRLNIESKVKDTQRNFMIAISTLGLVVTFFVYRSYREKKQANKHLAEKNVAIRRQKREIESQKTLVDIQNKEITDSINYARQIQSAILPTDEQIRKYLPQHFVLYKPKSIVSGDFFFFTEKKGKILVAAVDCTGHGVPGAFMSMIGHNLLSQIINENGVVKPSEILNYLHAGVRKVLQQNDTGEGNRDGMDIILVAIDNSFKTLEYAAANRPLYLIRDSKLNEVKSDKFSIGGFQAEAERKFTNHVIELQKDDSFYLFSDGYADQFGGEKGKKFMVKNLQKTLLQIQQLKITEQQAQLTRIFDKWKGTNEQVDDVLVIGIKA